MNHNYDNCRAKFDSLIDWNKTIIDKDRNEDTTRFHLIDTILTECLDWQKSNIVTEPSYNGEYADYVLSLSRPVLILEAKRQGNSFEIPIGKKDSEYSIKSLCKDNPEFKKAIEQVASYCQQRGIEIAVASNGWQVVAFVAVRSDGKPPLEGHCIVFSSLENIQDNFLQFWNYLSPQAVENRTLKNKLLGTILPELPPKLSSKIDNYPGVKNRNSMQVDLQIVSELILEDVLKYEDLATIFLEECYCNAGALSNYAAVSKDILKTRYENLFEENTENITTRPAVTKSGIDKELKEIASSKFKDIASSTISKRPILLIGDVGVGKSSFVNNLIRVEAKDIFEKCITFKVDLGTSIILATDIREAVINEIIKQLHEIYNIEILEFNTVRGIYHTELENFKKTYEYVANLQISPEKAKEKEIDFFQKKLLDKVEHIRRSLVHFAKGRNNQIVIFIDNCDQRDYNTQQTAFLISQEIAENWQPVTVFISLRPETFHNSLKKGALSGYYPKAFTIAPPQVDIVIQKRLEFAKKIANGEFSLNQFGGSIVVNSYNLRDMLDILLHSFEVNDSLYRFIDNISCGNIRYAIDIVKNFFGSGHVDTMKILSKNQENLNKNQRNYVIPLHEFLRAVIYGNCVYYHSESSYITNVFDVHYQDEKEHFLSLILLSILDSNTNSGKNNGFIEIQVLSNNLQGIGFIIDQIDTTIGFLISKNLVEPSTRGVSYDKSKLPSSLRITTTGAYHLHNLPMLFTYIDAIIVDTPVFNKEKREQIDDIVTINERLNRATIFVEYLDDVWKTIEGKQTFYDWQEISLQLKLDISRISRVLTKN